MKTFIKEHKQESIALLKQLTAIPAPSCHEQKRAAFIASWFQERNIPAYIDRTDNVIVMYPGASRQKVVFAAHIDTVFDDEKILIKEKGNILEAKGIGDDSANVINLMMAAYYVCKTKQEYAYTLLFIFNTGEEGLGNLKGVRQLFHRYQDIRYFYSFDLYLPMVSSISIGSHRYTILVKTAGGHSYYDFGKANAIVIASHILEELDQIQIPEDVTYNFGTIEGGTTINTIAPYCSFTYEYRARKDESLDVMKQHFLDILNKYQEASYQSIGIRPGANIQDDNELEAFTAKNKEVVETVIHKKTENTPISSDCNIPLSLNIPANCIGTITGGNAHQEDEWVDVTSLSTGQEIIISLISIYQKDASL